MLRVVITTCENACQANLRWRWAVLRVVDRVTMLIQSTSLSSNRYDLDLNVDATVREMTITL